MASGTIVNYHNCLRVLREFSLNTEFTVEVSTILKKYKSLFPSRRQYWQRFYRLFTDYLYRKGYCDNYVANILKIIRALLRWLSHQYGWQDYQFLPYQWIHLRQHTFEVISPDQFRYLLYDPGFNAKLNKRQKLIRDYMILVCTTALRAGDLLKLKKKNLIQKNHHIWIIVNQEKTRQQIRILLPEYLEAILQSYHVKGGRLLPKISNVNLNLGIKRIAAMAGWIYPVYKCRDKKGIPVPVVNWHTAGGHLRFYDVITTHTLRRSAITILLMMGMPEQLVRQISGHKTGSREFYRYVNLVQKFSIEAHGNLKVS